jgi:phage-related protein
VADGFKIADGYVEVETRFDGDRMVRDVDRAVDRAEPRLRSQVGGNIGNALTAGIGDRLRDSRGRFVKAVDDPVKKSGPEYEETGRRGIGRRLLSGIGKGLSQGKDMAVGLASGVLGAAKMPVLVAAVAVLGTVLAGGLTSALTTALGVGAGVAFLGLGAFALRENKKIRKEFEKTGKSISKTLRDAAKPLIGPFVTALKDARDIVKSLAPDLKGIFKDLAPEVKFFTSGVWGLLRNALSGIRDSMPGINAAFRGFSSALPGLGKAFGDFFRDVFKYPDLIKRLSSGLVNLVSGGISFLGTSIQRLTVIWGAFTNGITLWRMGWQNVMSAIDGGSGMFVRLAASLAPVKKAFGEVWKALVDFASETDRSELPAKFRTLVEKVKGVWAPLKAFLGTVWDEAWAFVKRVWNTKVKPWIEETALPWLRAKVQQAMSAVFRDMVNRAVGFLQSLPGRARSAIASLPGMVGSVLSSAASTARSRASSLVSGFIDRVRTLPSRARSALGSARSAIVGVFSGAGSWLVSAGRRIIDGLVSGIRSAIGRVRSALSELTNMIPDWKGPAAKDAKLLEPAGRSVIRGFQKGISLETPGLESQLRGLTAAIPRMAGSQQAPSGPSVHLGGLTVAVTVPAGSDGTKIGHEAAKEIKRALDDLDRRYR